MGATDALRQFSDYPFVHIFLQQLGHDECADMLCVILVAKVCRPGRPIEEEWKLLASLAQSMRSEGCAILTRMSI